MHLIHRLNTSIHLANLIQLMPPGSGVCVCMCVCVCVWGGGGTLIFSIYIGWGDFLGVQIFNFNIFGGFR